MKRFRNRYILVYNTHREIDYIACIPPDFNDFKDLNRSELGELEATAIKSSLENDSILYLATPENFPGLDEAGTLKIWTNFGIVRGVVICNNTMTADDIIKYLEQKKYNPEVAKAS